MFSGSRLIGNVPNGVEILPEISVGQTDGRTTAYSEHGREFTFAKKYT